MNCRSIAKAFQGERGWKQAKNYLRKNGLLNFLEKEAAKNSERYRPEFPDLARLHLAVRSRKCFTVLEFGVGFSTLVMADAVRKNQEFWKRLKKKPKVRVHTPFTIHSVDASRRFLDSTRQMIPRLLASCVKLYYSPARAGLFQDRSCHYYTRLPDVVPDFIYLDGPHPQNVMSKKGDTSWKNPDRLVMAADILRLEPLLLPGTLIVVDGREANARFIRNHLYRKWQVVSMGGELTVMELQEGPLGAISRNQMMYSLGKKR